MRSLGYIDGRKQTEHFVAYLLTQKVKTHIENSDGSDRWEIWVRNEDQLEFARQELMSFQREPDNPKYSDAVKTATSLLETDRKQRQSAARNIRRMPSRVRVGMANGSIPPLTMTLVVISIAISLLSEFGAPRITNSWGQTIVGELSFVNAQDFAQKQDPAASLKKGELWRTITPIFMHGSPLHLAMNLLMLVSLGRLIERLLGTQRFALLIFAAAVIPNLMQGLAPEILRGSPHFMGISGVVYALFGYIWIRSMLDPFLGVMIPTPIVVLMVGIIVVGFTVRVPGWNFADMCHLGGLLVGVGLAYASSSR